MNCKVRVLIADDCRDFVFLLVQYLKSSPEREIVGIAYDGRQTQALVRQTKPDILLLDIIMPVLDGMEALKKIREANEQLQVIVMSALDSALFIQYFDKLGIRHYFVKPFNFNKILQAIFSERHLKNPS